MTILHWTWILVGLSFTLYAGIAIWSRAVTTGDFYVAEKQVRPLLNGMATAADWMSAASFISMAGMISFMGRDGSIYLMGWTGGYVLLALLLAPYLRKYGKFTVAQFVGDRYYSQTARVVALVCAIFISFTYVAGQMRGVGVVFSRFLEVDITTGVFIGMGIVFFYAVLGGMKGITYTQVAQYCVIIVAYMIPAVFISIMLTGNPIPQLAYGGTVSPASQVLGAKAGRHLLDVLNGLQGELGFDAYTTGVKSTIDVFFITFALMVGTAGLPHVIIRFFTVPKVREARSSAGWALLFIAILYTTAPAVAAFARTNFLGTVQATHYENAPSWFLNWENTGLIAWVDKNDDGVMTYAPGEPFVGAPVFAEGKGAYGERLLSNARTPNANEVYVDRDIMVLANPEIAGLPNWVVALVAAGGLAAALSTAAGLLLVISSSFSHDLIKGVLVPTISERSELLLARVAAGAAVVVAGYFGLNPPGFVAQVVAFAFGLAAASFFPVLVMGVFWTKTTKEGAIAGMLSGVIFTTAYIVFFNYISPEASRPENWFFGISPEGIGGLGMVLNFLITYIVSKVTPEPPRAIQELVETLRYPHDPDEY